MYVSFDEDKYFFGHEIGYDNSYKLFPLYATSSEVGLLERGIFSSHLRPILCSRAEPFILSISSWHVTQYPLLLDTSKTASKK